jgi:hypothetical protein
LAAFESDGGCRKEQRKRQRQRDKDEEKDHRERAA